MALDITNSSIGVSREGMIQVKDSIKVNLIDESINSVNTNVEQLTSNIDNYWHGSAANAFKLKVNSEKSKVVTILKVLESKLELDLGSVAANNAIADAAVAEALGYSVGTTGFGSTPSVNQNSVSQQQSNSNYNQIIEDPTSTPERDIYEAQSIQVDNEVPEYVDTFGGNLLLGLQKTGSTIATAGTSILEGLGLFGEALGDTGAIVGTGLCTLGSLSYDAGTYIASKITGSDWHSSTEEMWNATMAYVAEENCKWMFDGLWEDTAAGQTISKYCYGFDITRGVGNGIGYTAGVVAVSIGTAGVATGAIGAGGTVSAGSVGTLQSTLPTAMGAVGATAGFGKGTQEAWGQGASLGEGLAYGGANAAWEGAQFYVGGKINSIAPLQNAAGNSAIRVGLDTVDSALEGIIRPKLQTIYSDKSYNELFHEAGGWGNVLTQGLMGGGLSALGEAGGLAKAFRNNSANNLVEGASNGVANSTNRFNISFEGTRSKVSGLFEQLSGKNGFGTDQGGNEMLRLLSRKNNDWLTDAADFDSFARSRDVFKGLSSSDMDEVVGRLTGADKLVSEHMQDVIRDYISKNSPDLATAQKTFMNSFDYIKSDYYDDAVGILTKQGMGEDDAVRFIKTLDRGCGGACAYASTCNEIFSTFADKPDEFKRVFGYDMFRTDGTGNKVLNTQPLLVDLYSYANTDKNVLPHYSNPQTTLLSYSDGKLTINSGPGVNQVNLSNQMYIRDDMINSFLQSKDPSLSIKHSFIDHKNMSSLEVPGLLEFKDDSRSLTVESLYSEFRSAFDEGNQMRLSIERNEHIVNMYNMDGSFNISTAVWREGNGHSVFITDVLKNGLEVSSWGERLFIPFEDLIGNNFAYQFGKIVSSGQ